MEENKQSSSEIFANVGDLKTDFQQLVDQWREEIRAEWYEAGYRIEGNDKAERAMALEGEMQYDRIYDSRTYEEGIKTGAYDNIEKLWRMHAIENGYEVPPESRESREKYMTSQEAREALERQQAFMGNYNTDIAAQMRERYPEIPPKLARDLDIAQYSRTHQEVDPNYKQDSEIVADFYTKSSGYTKGPEKQPNPYPDDVKWRVDSTEQEYPSRTMQQPHPEQPRYSREEIRAMIDAALPQIRETQAARARDLSAERDTHGYGY